MLGFERTSTGTDAGSYTATDDQVAWWNSRDLCPTCDAIVEPIGTTSDGKWQYTCPIEAEIKWTREK